LFPASSVGQKTYTWEETCKLLGRTDGPCAKGPEPAKSCLNYAHSNAFHADKLSAVAGKLRVELAPGQDAVLLLRVLSDAQYAAINSERLTIVRATGYKNAAAFIDNDIRCILFDPDWMRTATAEAVLVLGHELGHHFCRHPTDGFDPRRLARELEADMFSGFAIRQFERNKGKARTGFVPHLDNRPPGVLLDEALVAARKLYSAEGSRTHPPQAKRIAAIMTGYIEERQCR
jgi:Zn-dependent protease with chaperone function